MFARYVDRVVSRSLHRIAGYERLNLLSNRVIGAALRVHGELGPGCWNRRMKHASPSSFWTRGSCVDRQMPVPLFYRGRRMECGYRIDLLVNEELIVEVKAIERLEPVHSA